MFVGITSPYLQMIRKFEQFWKECIVVSSDSLAEFEIDELASICREWSKGSIRITDAQLLDLILFYKPDIVVQDRKYIRGIRSLLWDKQGELDLFFATILQGDNIEPKTFQTVYKEYKLQATNSSSGGKRIRPLIGKSYFDNYVMTVLSDYIDAEGRILAFPLV
jgi:hypothetical protein